MTAITFDTLRFVERLEAAGMPRAQAVALAEVQKESFHEALDSTLATKADLEKIEHKLIEHDGKFNLLHWMLAFNLAFTLAVLWKMFGH
jgi:hypothetical protein